MWVNALKSALQVAGAPMEHNACLITAFRLVLSILAKNAMDTWSVKPISAQAYLKNSAPMSAPATLTAPVHPSVLDLAIALI
jgi:hypothetical protein